MLTYQEESKLVAWAEWRMEHKTDALPRGVQAIVNWIWEGGPFPTFDRDEPYTFGEDHG